MIFIKLILDRLDIDHVAGDHQILQLCHIHALNGQIHFRVFWPADFSHRLHHRHSFGGLTVDADNLISCFDAGSKGGCVING